MPIRLMSCFYAIIPSHLARVVLYMRQTVEDFLAEGGKIEILGHSDTGMDVNSGVSFSVLKRGYVAGNRLKVWKKRKPAVINQEKGVIT